MNSVKLLPWLLLHLLLLPMTGYADYSQTAKGQAFIQSMTGQHGYTKAALQQLFSQVSRDDRILQKISRPAEKTKAWYEYKSLFINEQQIERGKSFYQKHQQVLQAAYQRFGVDPNIIVAILGIETRYGRVMGNDQVLTALATIAFDYPRREKFFTSELSAFLKMAKQEGFDPLTPQGSYAGAMGMAQFMPSSFLNYAVDYDGDGKRDLWHNPNDAIFSIANYLAKHGWERDAIIVDRAMLHGQDYLGRYQHKPFTTLADLKAQGVFPMMAVVADKTPAGMLRLQAKSGFQDYITFKNFAVITTYNTSPLYAMAVVELANQF